MCKYTYELFFFIIEGFTFDFNLYVRLNVLL